MAGKRSSRGIRIGDLPERERPRERLERRGAKSLSTIELLAILLRSGTKGVSALDLARRILAEYGSLDALAKSRVEELKSLRGVGRSKAYGVLAALELARRLAEERAEKEGGVFVRSPEDVRGLMEDELLLEEQEVFCCLYLNVKSRVLGRGEIFRGTSDASMVHPREIFRDALRRNTSRVILVHNHPSGDPTPSPEDIALTRRLVEAGRLLGIEVLDHVVVGRGRAVSFREKGLI